MIPSGSLCGGESHFEVPLERFYLNGHTAGFRPQIQKLEPPLYRTLPFTLGVEELIRVNETLRFVNLTTDCRKCHQCEECGKICLTSSFLKKHKRLHSSERPHKCSICNAAFKEKSYLKKHNVTHTGIKEFKCDFCDKRFSHQREFI